MRTIKLKVWDKKAKEWVGGGEAIDLAYSMPHNCFLFDNDAFDIPEDIEIVEFTGLHDKNGKEIYEGDIIEYLPNELIYPDKKEVYQVVWYHAGYAFQNEPNAYVTYLPGNKIKVIGNIYENPESLK